MHPEIDILLLEDNASDERLMTHMLARSGIPRRENALRVRGRRLETLHVHPNVPDERV